MAETIPTNTPWSLRDLKGTAADLVEQVQAAAFVPAEDKAAIVARILKADPAVKFWKLDAHFQVFDDQRGAYYSEGAVLRAL